MTCRQRHRDQSLADKTFTMQEYLEMSKLHPEWNYRELLNKAYADLIDAVHLRLNAELAAITAGLGDCREDRRSQRDFDSVSEDLRGSIKSIRFPYRSLNTAALP